MMKYNPSLDGARALAVLVVVAFHTNDVLFHGGFVGVDVFFVLSGFLITTILRGELSDTGAIDIRRFFFRRAVRLVPPLTLSLAGTYLAYAVFLPGVDLRTDVIVSMLYVSDYGRAFWEVPVYLKHTWSLSVEEHFYMIWPFFLLATRRMSAQGLFGLLIAMWLAATAWKVTDGLVWEDYGRTYSRFDTRMGGMILGSALAVRPLAVRPDTAGLLAKYALYTLAILSVGLAWLHIPAMLFGGFAAEVATAGLIVALMSGHQTGTFRFLAHPWLVYLGVLSYSIYLWHYGIAIVLRDMLDPVSAFALTLGISVGIAAVSHRFVEKPLRAWALSKSKPEPAREAATSAPPTAISTGLS